MESPGSGHKRRARSVLMPGTRPGPDMPSTNLPQTTRFRFATWCRENRFLLVFAVLASVMGTSVGTAKVVTSLYALHLGATEFQLGLIASGQVFGTLAMSVPVGFLVDHHGPARLFVIGSVLAGVIYVVIPLVPHPAFLLGAVTAIGFFMPMRFVSLNSVFFEQIRTLGEHKAGWYRGTHMTGMFLVGPGLAVALVAAAGFTGTWWLIAASFAFTIVLSPIVLARYARPGRGGRRPSLADIGRDLATLTRDRELRQVNLIDCAAQATNAFNATFIIAIALKVFHRPPSEAAAYVTGHGVVFIATLFVAGLLVRRVGSTRSCLGALAMATVGVTMLALAPEARWLWPGVVLLGFALGLLQTVTLTRIARIGARLGQGKVSGLNLFAGPMGALLGTFLGGLVGQAFGLQRAYLLFVPVHLLLAVWLARASHPTAAAAPALP